MPSLDYTESKVYFRNKLVPFAEANLSIASSPVLYGLAVYTTFSASWNSQQKQLYFFRLTDHYRRLVNSTRIMGFEDFSRQWPYKRFEKNILSLLQQNNVRENALIRACVFIDELNAGTRINNLTNNFSAYVYPFGQLLPANGAHVCVSSWMRIPDNVIPPRAKVNGSYAGASLAKNEALLNGYDDAILLDKEGRVSESTVANIFIIRGRQLITPSVDSHILEGITTKTILEFAKDSNIEALERNVERSELYIADEVFLCGTSADITPVLSIDKRPVGIGQKGEITKKLTELYKTSKQNQVAKYSKWLLPVY